MSTRGITSYAREPLPAPTVHDRAARAIVGTELRNYELSLRDAERVIAALLAEGFDVVERA